MTEREDIILDGAEAEAAAIRTDRKWWNRVFTGRCRTKLRYRRRTLLFIVLLAAFLLAYVMMFIYDNPMGDRINDWTDSVVAPVFTWIMTALGSLMGRDWSDMGTTFARLSTLGPLSFVVVATVIAFAISAIIAWVYGHYATKKSVDDGTSNFVAEATKRK